MGTYDYTFIPENDIDFVPTPDELKNLQKFLETVSPHLDAGVTEERKLFESGFLSEGITCPFCGAEVDGHWWSQAVTDSETDNQFADLDIVMPCCKKATTLDRLNYPWPIGFARFSVYISTAQAPDFDDDQAALLLPKIERRIGRKMKIIVEKY
ncbi:hypothetical protein CDO73_12445 [Saccharibacillus sp. O23]|uniref:hypothetical protein n=1 Tax=Saccharibacillus sp. O23 TaxID=2009338 RepID=UPI000B4E24DE|nr:hypothetical protein [Saccharibacillus sp. O23]OWR29887.1 hypothetical protein CDO73_12445 [Saccharibacillus sp. O23]